SAPNGWNASNSACLSVISWAGSSGSERMTIEADGPVPTACTGACSNPVTRSYTARTDSTSAGLEVPALGNWIWVPPLKSMPRLNPRSTIEPMQTSTTTPNTTYQFLRLPTTSNAPVPV